MLRRLFNKCLLRPEDISPSHESLRVVGTFNPGAIDFKNGTMLLVRVAETPAEERPGYTGLPRRDDNGSIIVDWLRNDELDFRDPRAVRARSDGRVRLTFISHIAAIMSSDGRSITSPEPLSRFEPSSKYEEFGVEDPRIVRIGSEYYFTYVAVSRHGAATALASTPDFKTFKRHGIIFPPENKDVMLFPDMIDGEYAAIHRPVSNIHFGPPEMWISRSKDLIHWGRHEQLLSGGSTWDGGRIGGGVPPIRTPRGWLEIYHGARPPASPGEVGTYAAGAMLLDIANPSRVLGRSADPIMVPETDFETGGFVTDIVFPTGAVNSRNNILVYYGAADTVTAVAELSRDEILATIK